jgi:hypothetical protein
MSSATRAAEEVRPPQLSGKQKVVYFATSNSSTKKSLFGETAFTGAPAGTAPTGKVYISVGALTVDAFVTFGTSSAGSVTTSTGWPIMAGSQQGFWINAGDVTHIVFVTTSSAGGIYWYVSSPEFDSDTSIGS